MKHASRFARGKLLLFACAVFTALVFAADIVDLREELRFISCPHSCADSDVSAGLADPATLKLEPILTVRSSHLPSFAKRSFLHLLPCSGRAPPFNA